MRLKRGCRTIWLLLAVLTFGLFVADADAQQQRRRRRASRRVTNPVNAPATTAQPQPTPSTTSADPTIVSTADDNADDQPRTTTTTRGRGRTRTGAAPDSDQEAMRRTVDRLTSQVNQLSDKIGKMEESQRTLLDMERLSRAESRAETMRAQLRDVLVKEADLQARLDQIEYDLRPESIERATQTFGSTRPEEVREARRRGLENERERVRTQLQVMTQSRARLETAIANADAEADTLRARLEQNNAATPPAGTREPNTDGAPTNTVPPPETSEPQPRSTP